MREIYCVFNVCVVAICLSICLPYFTEEALIQREIAAMQREIERYVESQTRK